MPVTFVINTCSSGKTAIVVRERRGQLYCRITATTSRPTLFLSCRKPPWPKSGADRLGSGLDLGWTPFWFSSRPGERASTRHEPGQYLAAAKSSADDAGQWNSKSLAKRTRQAQRRTAAE